ncbi:MAG: exodeoxyribonuclease 7 small subunit [Rhodomicrobium sp.]|nr:MAG: exodeoxyribonuclease 7 small subunit [Rhodomicrobium sp.]
MAKDTGNNDIKSMSFEAALAELEQIVGRLEHGDVPLEESIQIYERGEALRSQCDQLLTQAEAKVEKIAISPDGSAGQTQPIEID